ncbi:hypothetical protein MMC34_006277 [Xylographa carneopallida]|nr:hypothetical protein [Xylographa carneopallida]
MPAKGPIVIVGGGIASLSLARVLKARKIPSIVLERLGHASRIKDYGMGLRKWAYEPLSQRMGISASEFRARTAVDALVGGLGNIGRPLLNGRKGDPVEGESRSDLTTAEDDYYQASYAKVQDLLCQGLDVRMDHDVQALTPMANVARVLCRQNMVKSTLEIIEGPIVVVADGQYSNCQKIRSTTLQHIR